MVVLAGPYRSTTAAAAMASRSSSTSSSGTGGPGRSSHAVPISSSSRVIGADTDAGDSATGSRSQAGPLRITRPVPWSRMPADVSRRQNAQLGAVLRRALTD